MPLPAASSRSISKFWEPEHTRFMSVTSVLVGLIKWISKSPSFICVPKRNSTLTLLMVPDAGTFSVESTDPRSGMVFGTSSEK